MRKASPETQLRHAKSQLNSLKSYQKSLISELKDRRGAGEMLSNIAFNLAQRETDLHLKAVLDECRKRWDAIRSTPL